MKARTTSLYQLSEVHWCCAHVLSCFSRVWLFATLWTRARRAPLSTGFSGQGCWSGLWWPPSGDLPDSGIEPMSPALAGGSFTTGATWEALTLVPVSQKEQPQLQGQLKEKKKKNHLFWEGKLQARQHSAGRDALPVPEGLQREGSVAQTDKLTEPKTEDSTQQESEKFAWKQKIDSLNLKSRKKIGSERRWALGAGRESRTKERLLIYLHQGTPFFGLSWVGVVSSGAWGFLR